MDETGNRADSGWHETAEVLAGAVPVYLRAAGNGQLHLLHCLRFDAAGLEATLRWPADSDDQPPPVGTAVQIYLRAPQRLSINRHCHCYPGRNRRPGRRSIPAALRACTRQPPAGSPTPVAANRRRRWSAR